ncbi:hypothetical protein ACQ4M3_25480 [Leptolyngbya sp. AN03gr2]|uniref:hypothetical protein n=1 Tax=unclassified Leptolyngbya TaxID=2650499 RepID=UPI003D31EA3D
MTNTTVSAYLVGTAILLEFPLPSFHIQKAVFLVQLITLAFRRSPITIGTCSTLSSPCEQCCCAIAIIG